MAFRFRLDRLLRLRRQLRREAVQTLGAAQERVERLDAALRAIRSAQASAWRAEACVREWTGAELQDRRRFDAAVRAYEAQLLGERLAAAAECGERRAAALARRRDERVLELLRTRRLQRWQAWDERERTVTLDELALRGGRRPGRESVR